MADLQQVMVSDWIKVWKMYTNEGDRLYQNKDYMQAMASFQKAIESSISEKGGKYADSLTKLGLCYFSMKNYNKAEPLLQEALEIRKQILGTQDAEYACSLSYLACLYRDKKQFPLAEKLFQEALGIFERIFGKQHVYTISITNSIALLYKMNRQYGKAENLLRYCLENLEKIFGKEHAFYATALINLASLYRDACQYELAEPLYLKATQIYKKFLGINHPVYADCLIHLGLLYQGKKEYEKAYKIFTKALEIRRSKPGEQSLEYANALFHLAILHHEQKAYTKAEPLFLQGIEISKSFVSKDSPQYLEFLQQIGRLYLDKKEYGKAMLFFSEGAEILRKSGNNDNPYYPIFLNNVALACKKQENYVKAESLLNISISLLEQSFGKTSSEFIIGKNNLAVLYQEKGEYDKAELLFREVAEFCKAKEKKENYASMLNNMALVYQEKGDHSKSESFFFQALGIFELVLGKENKCYRMALNNIANLYLAKAEYDRAESLLSDAIEITEQAVGQYHPDYLETIALMARLYQTMGVYSKPEHLLRQSIEIQEHIWGKDHPKYSNSLCILAEFYQSMGEYGKAESLFRQSLEIRERSLGKNHPLYADNLHKLAWLKTAIKEYKDAMQFFLKAAPIENKMALRLCVAGEEKKLEKYLQSMEISYYAILSLFYQNYESLKSFTLEVYSLVLQRKRIAQELTPMKATFFEENGPDFQNKYNQWKDTLQNLVKLLFADSASLSAEEYRKNYKKLEEEESSLEKELALKSPLFSLEQKLFQISPSMLSLLLPSQSVIVEFVYLKEIHLKNRKYLEPRYLAFIQKQDNPSQIETIELGEASQIEKLIVQYKKDSLHGKRDTQVLSLSSLDGNTKVRSKDAASPNSFSLYSKNLKDSDALEAIPAEEDAEITKMLLHATIFMPVLSYIGQSKRLIIAPDGMISFFPFEILEDASNHFLVEDYDISYVQSGKDLLRFTYNKKPQSRSLIIANPDFDLQKTSLRQTQRKDLNRIPGKRDYQLEQCLSQGLDSILYFPPLPESQSERNIISNAFSGNCDIWEQEKTLDFKIKKIKAPKILHLATHCFFVQDAEKNEIQPYMDFWNTKSKGKRFVNPLLRAGIAVSGINTFLKRQEMSDDLEDGLLTALDICNINLFGTELVTLSLCETGSGKIKTPDAFCSLISSFLLAGAKNILTSLWKMPEKERLDLLQRFYLKVLAGKKKDIALRESQREMIQHLRAQNKKPSPSLWGAFICFGDPN